MFDTTKRGLYLHHFSDDISSIALPERFTFPFYYEPHRLSVMASEEVMDYLDKQDDFVHHFGLNDEADPIGKMFGVMVVKDKDGHLGYLAAFSGKMAESNFLNGFCPPIYDTLDEEGFYKKGEAKLNIMNDKIERMESDEKLAEAQCLLKKAVDQSETEITALKQKAKSEKKKRKAIRAEKKEELSDEAYAALLEELKNQSLYYHFSLRDLKAEWEQKISNAEEHLAAIVAPINVLKDERRALSNHLQKLLHEQYRFLDAEGKQCDLIEIFNRVGSVPPAGAGECAAPKLFQYAYEHGLEPVCMAEFWWGVPPPSAVRKHGSYYPSCRGKCEPILGHMMNGLQVDENPLKEYNSEIDIPILYEDDYMVVVNKPAEFLSVPGKTIKDSILTRLKEKYPEARGGILLHRLDMSTSGILLAAKHEDIYRHLQRQFMKRTIKKSYIAVLEGELNTSEGIIDLPLRVDLDDRPRQLVCEEHGKQAVTKYEVIEVKDGKTRVRFFPITGRTHQLRVHAAHKRGLGTPIIGDDLYGRKGERLHLHAASITFVHPYTKDEMTITCPAPF